MSIIETLKRFKAYLESSHRTMAFYAATTMSAAFFLVLYYKFFTGSHWEIPALFVQVHGATLSGYTAVTQVDRAKGAEGGYQPRPGQFIAYFWVFTCALLTILSLLGRGDTASVFSDMGPTMLLIFGTLGINAYTKQNPQILQKIGLGNKAPTSTTSPPAMPTP